MATNSTPNILEARLRVRETGQALTISYFVPEVNTQFEKLSGMDSVTVTTPARELEHLVTLEIALERPADLIGYVRFDLKKEYEGRDIPIYLPNDVRYHVLMTSTAVFNLLADQAS